MPFPRSWLPRISAILKTVEESAVTKLDRDAVAQIFDLKRRAALALMKEVGPEPLRSGRWVVCRENLRSWIEAQSKEAELEMKRRDRFTRAIVEADTSLLRRPSNFLAPRKLSSEQQEAYAAGLPESVSLDIGSPNRLIVEFMTIEQLAERLLATGLALNNRLSVYQDLLEPQSQDVVAENQAEREDAEYFRNWRPD